MMPEDYYALIPTLETDEFAYLQSLTENLPKDKLVMFLQIYNGRRQRPETILLLTLLGFFLVSGVQRFVLGHIGMGILYFLTGGLCLVGTIYDLVNYKKLTFDYNRKQAVESLALIINDRPLKSL